MLPTGLSVAALLALFIGVPASLFLLGVRFFRRAKTPFGRLLPAVVATLGAAGLYVVGHHLYRAAPGHSGILSTGVSPDGREYCLVQSHNGFPGGFGEPYTVSLFVRDDERIWRWHYVEHQAPSWASGSVVFDGETVHAYQGSELYRSVELSLERSDADAPWASTNDLVAKLSADQVAARHRERNGH